MNKTLGGALAALPMLLAAGAALAGVSEQRITVPEPEVASLFAGGAIAALLWARHRRRK
ncbi:MAG: PEP-CTERM sorting domain-containing protein [Alphaproteobacteria bacterium]|nr:MAG: PEP-CTERM sorting domain-containing protein [Alphaproteobacteria bacterium]